MGQGWLKEVLEENRRKVDKWPEWKKSQQISASNDKKDESNQATQIAKSHK